MSIQDSVSITPIDSSRYRTYTTKTAVPIHETPYIVSSSDEATGTDRSSWKATAPSPHFTKSWNDPIPISSLFGAMDDRSSDSWTPSMMDHESSEDDASISASSSIDAWDDDRRERGAVDSSRSSFSSQHSQKSQKHHYPTELPWLDRLYTSEEIAEMEDQIAPLPDFASKSSTSTKPLQDYESASLQRSSKPIAVSSSTMKDIYSDFHRQLRREERARAKYQWQHPESLTEEPEPPEVQTSTTRPSRPPRFKEATSVVSPRTSLTVARDPTWTEEHEIPSAKSASDATTASGFTQRLSKTINAIGKAWRSRSWLRSGRTATKTNTSTIAEKPTAAMSTRTKFLKRFWTPNNKFTRDKRLPNAAASRSLDHQTARTDAESWLSMLRRGATSAFYRRKTDQQPSHVSQLENTAPTPTSRLFRLTGLGKSRRTPTTETDKQTTAFRGGSSQSSMLSSFFSRSQATDGGPEKRAKLTKKTKIQSGTSNDDSVWWHPRKSPRRASTSGNTDSEQTMVQQTRPEGFFSSLRSRNREGEASQKKSETSGTQTRSWLSRAFSRGKGKEGKRTGTEGRAYETASELKTRPSRARSMWSSIFSRSKGPQADVDTNGLAASSKSTKPRNRLRSRRTTKSKNPTRGLAGKYASHPLFTTTNTATPSEHEILANAAEWEEQHPISLKSAQKLSRKATSAEKSSWRSWFSRSKSGMSSDADQTIRDHHLARAMVTDDLWRNHPRSERTGDWETQQTYRQQQLWDEARDRTERENTRRALELSMRDPTSGATPSIAASKYSGYGGMPRYA